MDLFDGDIIETEGEWLNRTWDRMEQENPEQTILGGRMGTPAEPHEATVRVCLVPIVSLSEGVGAPSPSHSSEATLELD